jgi:phospholipid/cholesterol/gamma-HCH transport system substrate-binding protein
MEVNKHYFRLGLFVFTTIVVLAAILFILGGRSLFQPSFTFETYFNESVAGLDIGSPVRFRGVPLGQVSEIVTSAAAYETDVPIGQRRGYIVVRAKVTGSESQVRQWRNEVAEMVKGGMRVQTQLAGITGQQYLSLDLFDAAKYPPLPFDWTPEHPYVPSAASVTAEIIANAQAFLASLNEADVKALGQNLNTLIVTLNSKIGQLPVAELAAEASAVLKDARVTIRRIGSTSSQLDRLLGDPKLKQTVDNVAALSEALRKVTARGDLERLVGNLDAAAARLDGLIGDNQYDIRVIVQDLRTTADNLRAVSEVLKRYPAGALVGGPPEKIRIPGKSP